jgi:hypothetical protein
MGRWLRAVTNPARIQRHVTARRNGRWRLVGLGLVAAAGCGCVLDFSGLAGGSVGEPGDAGMEFDGLFDVAESDVSPDASPDAPGCSVLSCGACQQPCPDGGCPAIELVSGAAFADSPRGIAIDANALLWVNQASGSIVRLSDDSPDPQVLTTGQAPVAIAASSGFIAWAERDGVWACEAADCATTKRLLADSVAPGSVPNVAIEGTTAYWTDRGAGNDAHDGQVRGCDVVSCTTPEVFASGQFRAHGLFVGSGLVFWSNQGDGYETGSCSSIR